MKRRIRGRCLITSPLPVPTLDQWIEENALDLNLNIKTHLHVFTRDSDITDEDRNTMLRLVMMSVRDWSNK